MWVENKNILITGGCGFIGSNLVLHLVKKYPNYKLVNLDLMTYASDASYLESLKNNPNYVFVKGDIRDEKLVNELFDEHNIDSVIHLAAESHVDNSIKRPLDFVTTNVVGTCVLLEAFRNKGKGRFHYVSTDEIYGTLGATGKFSETTPFDPNSPYSASKASGNFFVNAYSETYKLNVITTSCSNNYGPHQHREKLIPTIVRTALAGKDIPIYGKGDNVRDWLFVEDHCVAIDEVFHNGKIGEIYNVGGDKELNNLELANKICDILDELKPKTTKYSKQLTFVEDRKGHDFRYAVDFSKIHNELNWNPTTDFEGKLRETIKWCIKNS
jgi:dTDP-glucose 4,6-dehydratase